MKYLILTVPSVDYAKAISLFLWKVTIGRSDKSTKYFNHWITHPSNGKVALVFPNVTITIHPNANAQQLINTIKGAITEEEEEILIEKINEGGVVKPIDFLPKSLSGNVKTYKQMKNWGWFPVED